MALLSTYLTVLLGPTVPVPAPPRLMENLQQVQVTMSDSARSGFQLVIAAGRGGPAGALDHPLLTERYLRPFDRVVLVLTLHGTPTVLMDGVITHRELTPGSASGPATFTVTGEDLGVLMDLEERTAEYPAQSEAAIATRLILRYARYGLVPRVVPPPVIELSLPIEHIPVQRGTDLAQLTAMARRFGYVFHITPGPLPLTSTAYWGPPTRVGRPAPALSVDFGPATNVEQLAFRSDALAATQVRGRVQDRLTDTVVPVRSVGSIRPPLAAEPDWLVNRHLRTTLLDGSGLTAAQAFSRAQGMAEESNGGSLTVTGRLDTERYGALLPARGLVGVRGAGWSHDGLYHVKQVTHSIARGRHTQEFTLTREGVGSTTPVVRP
ncbi:hypothetical protein ACFZC6_05450 [Streptomyces ossamyceticus]|uniref:hypothetical protein n=1 Tax=Streptomyces ossamyceticus TaxID=249581 RepID=UPI003427EB10